MTPKGDSHPAKKPATRAIDLTFDRRPSSLVTLWQAFKTRAIKPISNEHPVIPEIKTRWNTAAINRKHLQAYSKICGIPTDTAIPVLYPLMLAYPFNLRIIGLKDIPLSMFTMLNTRTVVTASRPIPPDQPLDIICSLSNSRIVEKGFEIDIRSVVAMGGDHVWECVKTFYFRGRFGEADSRDKSEKLRPIPQAPAVASWHLPAGKGFRFARISGDSNGVHYNRYYAKAMGFKRDFAQPMLITGTCLEKLGKSRNSDPVRLDFRYKGQVYYERQLSLRHQHDRRWERFDLYCEGNDRPCICCEITPLPATAGPVVGVPGPAVT